MAITATTVTQAVGANDTSIVVASTTGITNPNFQTGAGITVLFIDQEYFLVTSVNTTTKVVGVIRGFNSSASVAHTNSSQVQIGLLTDFPLSNDFLVSQGSTNLIYAALNQPAIFLTGSADAINPAVPGFYEIKTAGVDAMTLTAPPASAEGNIIEIVSDTTNAHTLTATSLLANGTALKTTATYPAFRGAYLKLRASNGVWQVLSNGASAGVVVLT
jgi:hypothetical protein